MWLAERKYNLVLLRPNNGNKKYSEKWTRYLSGEQRTILMFKKV